MLLLLVFISCTKDKPTGTTNTPLPSCISQRIEQIKAEDPGSPRTEIWKYNYNNKVVYFITASCCDNMSDLYDEKCNLLCHPDGGLTGQGDGGCSDFFTARINGTLVWKDLR